MGLNKNTVLILFMLCTVTFRCYGQEDLMDDLINNTIDTFSVRGKVVHSNKIAPVDYSDLRGKVESGRYVRFCADFNGTVHRLIFEPENRNRKRSLRQISDTILLRNGFRIRNGLSVRSDVQIQCLEKQYRNALDSLGIQAQFEDCDYMSYVCESYMKRLHAICLSFKDLDGRRYILADFIVEQENISLTNDFLYKALEKDGKLSLHSILFDVNKYTVQPASIEIIADIAHFLKKYPAKQIVVVGHTDSDGDSAFNKELSEKRAQSIKDVLVKTYGVEARRISVLGKGEAAPMADNGTELGKRQNRRVEIVNKP